MFIYNVYAPKINDIYLCGLIDCLNDIPRNNPGWYYRLHQEEEPGETPHLTVLDFTKCTTDAMFNMLNNTRGYKMLVLVRSQQTDLIAELMLQQTCSILCVDERYLRIRDVIECSLRRRRYVSPMILVIVKQKKPFVDPVNLTCAERRVLELLDQGKNGVQISHELFRSQKTISSHKRNIMKKLGLTEDIELKMIISEMRSKYEVTH